MVRISAPACVVALASSLLTGAAPAAAAPQDQGTVVDAVATEGDGTATASGDGTSVVDEAEATESTTAPLP
jgi:hypothetical protein